MRKKRKRVADYGIIPFKKGRGVKGLINLDGELAPVSISQIDDSHVAAFSDRGMIRNTKVPATREKLLAKKLAKKGHRVVFY